MVSLESLITAYYECRRKKRGTRSALRFEMDWEAHVIDLYERINAGTYQPGPSDAFMVTRPTLREIFAAQFPDRTAHTWVALRLEPLLEKRLTGRTFACRKGMGQAYGVQRLKADLRQCSQEHTRDCWICKVDIKGFFMSIDKRVLLFMVERLIEDGYSAPDKPELLQLCRTIIMHRPEQDCVKKSTDSMWKDLAPEKSLFTNRPGCGLPIGNHPSQLFANLYLDTLDKMLDSLGIVHHGRYADDLYMMHPDKAHILASIPKLRAHLAALGLTLHPRKFYLQHYKKGVSFTGAIVKPGRTYCEGRLLDALAGAVAHLDAVCDPLRLEHAVQSVNSYLGMLIHHNTYGVRRRLLGNMKHAWKYIYVDGHMEKVVVRKAYRRTSRDMLALLEAQ